MDFGHRMFALGLALVVATALFAIPGYLTWDSGTYHLMVRTLYTTGGFTTLNGSAELSSPLLEVGLLVEKDGGLVSQYPELYTVLVLPFYALFGFRGFMVLNTAAFVGICVLVWRMARWFSDDRHAPLAAVAVYVAATYAIEYTQASFPHLSTTFLICLSAWLVWSVVLETKDQTTPLAPRRMAVDVRCLLAGLLLGLGIGVRLDTIFAGLAIGLPFLIYPVFRVRSMLMCALGVLPPMLALAWINVIKFGDFSPFSYGRPGAGSTGSVVAYFPVAGAFAVAIAFVIWNRYRPVRFGRRGIFLVSIAILLFLGLTAFGHRLLDGLFQLLVDMRFRPERWESGLSRSAGGALVYHDSVKKSLLESCPYLVLIIIPAIRGIVSGAYGARWLLWLVPAGFVGFYGYLAWHGGVGWNLRYFNPALPFLAILASHELLRVLNSLPVRRGFFWAGAATLWFTLVAVFFYLHIRLDLQETIILNGGLLLAALLLIFQVAGMMPMHALSTAVRPIFAALFVLALVWSSALTVGFDYLHSAAIRAAYLRAARDIEPHIQERALIVTYQPNVVWGLLDSGKEPIIARYLLGMPSDAVKLITTALDQRPVYWQDREQDRDAFTVPVFDALRAQGIVAEAVLEPDDSRPYRLYRFHVASKAAPRK